MSRSKGGGGHWWTPQRRLEVGGAVIVIVSVLTLVLFMSSGGVVRDAWMALWTWLFGWGAWAAPFGFGVLGVWLFLDASEGVDDIDWSRPAAGAVLALAILSVVHIVGGMIAVPGNADTHIVVRMRDLVEVNAGGGRLGYAIALALTRNLGVVTSLALLTFVVMVAAGALAGRSVGQTMEWLGAGVLRGLRTTYDEVRHRTLQLVGALRSAWTSDGSDDPVPTSTGGWAGSPGSEDGPAPADDRPDGGGDRWPDLAALEGDGDGAGGNAEAEGSSVPTGSVEWEMPRVDAVFDEVAEAAASPEDAQRQAALIEQTLGEFGIPAKVVRINRGPRITQFGLEPGMVERGGRKSRVKVSKIVSLQNDLALALAAAPIRIQAPVPGRPYLGIEVPNQGSDVVGLRQILESPAFRDIAARGTLPIGLGRDISGQAVAADLARMPHLLIAGATGSGKSVAINVLVCSLLMTHSPETLKLLLVDPKRVELVGYRGLPHLGSPVVVEVERVVGVLQWAVREMDRRYKQFAEVGARNIEGWNRRRTERGRPPMPYLVIIIDELADLMMVAPEEAERLITRLAQLARATGIHLVLATQRPSVDVVTGLIKANFPARIAFAVSSGVDSRVILDTAGAEKLLGQGDMLYQGSDSSKLRRMQGAYVSDEEIDRLTSFWKREASPADPGDEDAAGGALGIPEPLIQPELWDKMLDEDGGALSEERDPLWDDAVSLIQSARTASTSFLQRKLRIGYSRAARLLDALEEAGLVGPPQGNQGRDVLVEPDDDPEQVAADYRARLEAAFSDGEEDGTQRAQEERSG